MIKTHDELKIGGFMVGAGKPWSQQYMINKSENEDITGWTKVGNLPEDLFISQTIITKNRVYLLGGNSRRSAVNTIYSAIIDDNGIIGEWTEVDPLPIPLFNFQAITVNDRVYLLGGCDERNEVCAVLTAPINEDGSIGKWSRSDSLLKLLIGSQAIVVKDRIYVLGGTIGYNSSNKVYTALINKDGTLGKWEESDPLPGLLSCSQSVVIKNRIYLMGGSIDWIVTSSSVYTADINDDGTLGKWTTSNPLPEALSDSQVIVTNNKVYLLGGYKFDIYECVGEAVNTVYIADINEDGSLSEWVEGTPLPEPLCSFQVLITKNYIYLLGGYGLKRYSTSIYRANFNGGLNDYSAYYSSNL